MTSATPVLAWNTPRAEWLAARRHGLGASDVAAALGFSTYTTPWQVWMEKTGQLVGNDDLGAAAKLGIDLEPWIIGQAPAVLGQAVHRTPHQLYAHTDHPWRMCSPDAFAADGWGVQAKTSGLASPGFPKSWADDGIPLGYELQCRWEMHVMDQPGCHLVALVAGLGLIHRPIARDMEVEHLLVGQVDQWWTKYVVGGEEPSIGAGDYDLMAILYPKAQRPEVDLTGTPALSYIAEYEAARTEESAAKTRKEAAGANIKRLIGDAIVGKVNGERVATWAHTKTGARRLHI